SSFAWQIGRSLGGAARVAEARSRSRSTTNPTLPRAPCARQASRSRSLLSACSARQRIGDRCQLSLGHAPAVARQTRRRRGILSRGAPTRSAQYLGKV